MGGGGSAWRGRGRGVQTGGVADESFFERACAVQPLGDAGKNERDVAGAEVAGVRCGVARLERGGEFAAVVDELADEGEEATDAAFLFRAGWGGIGRRVWGGGGRRG
jgi:hypothetical protein